MNKYERKPDAVIDLHGYTVSEAREVLKNTINEGKITHARVIVGKGIHSKNGPVLREGVKDFLISFGVKFSQSKIENGGEGALEVYF